MEILNYQQAFGAEDITSSAMVDAIDRWFHLYYRRVAEAGEDPCQRIAFQAVSKLTRTVFAEYNATSESPFVSRVLQALDKEKSRALPLALVGGECYLKPVFTGNGFRFVSIPRNQILIFARNIKGEPTDVGTVEFSYHDGWYYNLLERRTLDEKGYLTIQNKLFRSKNPNTLGARVALSENPDYRLYSDRYTFPGELGSVGLVRLRTPILNCVDGSNESVSLYAPAVGLIHTIDRNEFLLNGEFERGQSRVFASRDLLRDNALQDNLFVGLDEDPERLGITVFAPEIRYKAYLERKQEYLRNVESVIGLQRGMLCDVNLADRTATEINASQAEHLLTAMDFQRMWQEALEQAADLCTQLGGMYGLDPVPGAVQVDWGNGVLYDEEKLWQDYKDMVSRGLIAPEVALGWRFNLPSETEEERAYIRKKYM